MMKYKKTLISILTIVYMIAWISWFFVPELLTLHPLIMAVCGIAVLVILEYDAISEKSVQ